MAGGLRCFFLYECITLTYAPELEIGGELEALGSLLSAAEKYLAPGGTVVEVRCLEKGLLAIITFHSLEDDMVRKKALHITHS